jgi:hypothetical protein
MDFGIALPTAADSWRVTKEAEELGFTHAWFYDTQMLSADCFVAMGAAAVIQVVCPNWARTDLCGGREVTRVLTAKVGFRGPSGPLLDPTQTPTDLRQICLGTRLTTPPLARAPGKPIAVSQSRWRARGGYRNILALRYIPPRASGPAGPEFRRLQR